MARRSGTEQASGAAAAMGEGDQGENQSWFRPWLTAGIRRTLMMNYER